MRAKGAARILGVSARSASSLPTVSAWHEPRAALFPRRRRRRQGVAASGGGLHGERRAPGQRRRFHRCARTAVTRVPPRVPAAKGPRGSCPCCRRRRCPSHRRPSIATSFGPTPRRGGGGRVPTVAAGAAAAGARL